MVRCDAIRARRLAFGSLFGSKGLSPCNQRLARTLRVNLALSLRCEGGLLAEDTFVILTIRPEETEIRTITA